MTLQNIIDLKSKFVAREVGNELVLVPLTGSVAHMNELFTLNETGRFIWEHLEEGATADSLLQLLLDEFDVDDTTARIDIEGFLSRLSELFESNRKI